MNPINPLKWKAEHRAALFVACAAGALIGVAIGFSMRFRGVGTFTYWIENNFDTAFFWALVGAAVVGAVIYCYRAFSN